MSSKATIDECDVGLYGDCTLPAVSECFTYPAAAWDSSSATSSSLCCDQLVFSLVLVGVQSVALWTNLHSLPVTLSLLNAFCLPYGQSSSSRDLSLGYPRALPLCPQGQNQPLSLAHDPYGLKHLLSVLGHKWPKSPSTFENARCRGPGGWAVRWTQPWPGRPGGAWPVPLCTGDTQHGVLIQEMRHFKASAALFLPFSLLGLVLVIGNLELL